MLFLYCENITFPNKTLLICAHNSILDEEIYILFQPKIGENQRAFQACALLTLLLSLGLVVYLLVSFIFPKFLHWLVQINLMVVALFAFLDTQVSQAPSHVSPSVRKSVRDTFEFPFYQCLWMVAQQNSRNTIHVVYFRKALDTRAHQKTLPEAQRTQKLTPRLGLNLATTWRHLH